MEKSITVRGLKRTTIPETDKGKELVYSLDELGIGDWEIDFPDFDKFKDYVEKYKILTNPDTYTFTRFANMISRAFLGHDSFFDTHHKGIALTEGLKKYEFDVFGPGVNFTTQIGATAPTQ